MAVAFGLRLPESHPHVTQTFHLIHPHCAAAPGSDAFTPDRLHVFCVAVADHNDFYTLGKSEHVFSRQVTEFANINSHPRSLLVIDGATEGWPFDAGLFMDFHESLKSLGVDPRRVVIISTNYLLDTAYSEWVAQTAYTPINFFIYDYWCFRVAGELKNSAKFHGRTTEIFDVDFNVDRKILSLNRMPKAHRAAVILKLLDCGELDSSLVSFMPDHAVITEKETDDLLAYYRLLGWSTLTELLDRQWSNFVSRLPLTVDQGAETEYLSYVFGEILSTDYSRVGFTVITESDFGIANVDRVTEKPFKAVANRCPYLLVGQPNQLRRMEALGFESYPMFDNSYDTIVEPNQRLDAILREVDRLSTKALSELQRIRLDMHDITVRNLRQLVKYAEDDKINSLAFKLHNALRSVEGRLIP